MTRWKEAQYAIAETGDRLIIIAAFTGLTAQQPLSLQAGLRHLNDGHENSEPSKLRGTKLQGMKLMDQVTEHKDARHENDGPICRASCYTNGS